MNKRPVALWIGLASVLAAVLVLVMVAPTVLTGQQNTSTSGNNGYTPPRTAEGHPDISGYYTNMTYTPLQRSPELGDKEFFTEQEATEFFKKVADAYDQTEEFVHYDHATFGLTPRQDGAKPNLRTSLIVDPRNGKIPPFTPEAQKRIGGAAPQGRRPLAETARDVSRCGPNGNIVPLTPALYNGSYLIVQSPGYLTIIGEQNVERRTIPLDGRPHNSRRTQLGSSRGRWEGDTLVVETINFSPTKNFRGSPGTFRLVERFRRAAPDVVDYRFTVEDPATWTSPWTAEIPLYKIKGPMFESACHEGNVDAIATLKNARLQEKGRIPPPSEGRRRELVTELPLGFVDPRPDPLTRERVERERIERARAGTDDDRP